MKQSRRIAGSILVGALCFAMAMPAFADSKSDVSSQINSLEGQASELESELASMKANKTSIESYIAELDTKIKETLSALDTVSDEIEQTDQEIKTTKANLKEAEANQETQYEALKARIKAIYESEEDASFFSFDDRIMLVKEGTKHLKNVTVLPSGSFMISKKTFAAYSNKAKLQNEKIDASLDVNIFANYIAPSLGITVRFAGEEPLDNVTRQYNETMRRILPEHGIEFRIIKRKIQSGEPISASRVRKLLEEGEFDKIKEIVPATTYQYLIKNY